MNNKPIPNVKSPRVQTLPKDTSPARREMRDRIRKHLEAKTMARLPHHNTYLGMAMRSTEQIQVIYNKETNTYLNYRQLLRHPKFKEA